MTDWKAQIRGWRVRTKGGGAFCFWLKMTIAETALKTSCKAQFGQYYLSFKLLKLFIYEIDLLAVLVLSSCLGMLSACNKCNLSGQVFYFSPIPDLDDPDRLSRPRYSRAFVWDWPKKKGVCVRYEVCNRVWNA